jgi:hypothetical protein
LGVLQDWPARQQRPRRSKHTSRFFQRQFPQGVPLGRRATSQRTLRERHAWQAKEARFLMVLDCDMIDLCMIACSRWAYLLQRGKEKRAIAKESKEMENSGQVGYHTAATSGATSVAFEFWSFSVRRPIDVAEAAWQTSLASDSLADHAQVSRRTSSEVT